MIKKTTMIKNLIIGAGPGGLQLAYYFEKNNIDYLILDKAECAGNTFNSFPRHKKLISINKVYTGFNDKEINLRYDWNSLLSDDYHPLFTSYSKDYFPNSNQIVNYFNDYAKIHKLKIRYNLEVINIKKDKNFVIKTRCGQILTAERVIISTGLVNPYIPNIKGIEHSTNYINCSIEPKHYINKRILIIGKGNSAFETADHLIGVATKIHLCSPNSLKLAWKSHFVGHLRAVNNNLLDTYQLKSQNAIIDANISQIKKENNLFYVTYNYSNANGEVEEIVYDEIICCAGFIFDSSIFDESSSPELAIDNRLPRQKPNWESSNIENLYFAGTLTQMRDYKKSTSAFIHGFRYNSKCLFHMLQYKDQKINWPTELIKLTSENISKKIINSVNRTSVLWQQFGFIGNILIIKNSKESLWVENIPLDYAKEYYCKEINHYFVIILDYGHEIFEMSPDIFNVNRVHRDDFKNADKSAFLHPIIKEYKDGVIIDEHHILEDFENKWDEEDIHYLPLLNFFNKKLGLLSKNACS